MKRGRWIALGGLLLLGILPFVGQVPIRPSDLLAGGWKADVFWTLRVPRVLLALGGGGLLALAGLIFQHLFRNGLATPDTTGVSAGAAFGAALALKFPLPLPLGTFGQTFLFAFLGGLLALLVLLAVVRWTRDRSIYTLLMAGIATAALFSASTLLIQYLLDAASTQSMVRWLMGGVAAAGYREALAMGLVLALLLAGGLLFRRQLLLIAIGDEVAAGKGMDPARFRLGAFVAGSMATGAAVALIGPVGFIGLIVPHLARLWSRGRFQQTLVLTPILGALLLAGADAVARTVAAPAEIPVGILTAMLGAPFFFFILARHLRR